MNSVFCDFHLILNNIGKNITFNIDFISNNRKDKLAVHFKGKEVL